MFDGDVHTKWEDHSGSHNGECNTAVLLLTFNEGGNAPYEFNFVTSPDDFGGDPTTWMLKSPHCGDPQSDDSESCTIYYFHEPNPPVVTKNCLNFKSSTFGMDFTS